MAALSPEPASLTGGGLTLRRAKAALAEGVALQSGRVALWTPVFAGAGAAVYLGAPVEPGCFITLAPLVVLLGLRLLTPRAHGRTATVLILVFFAAAGFAAGKIRMATVDAPIAFETGAVPISGWVVDVADPSQRGSRLLIAPVRIGDLPAGDLPPLIRITAPGYAYGPGAAVRFTGLVNPPPPPASPGGFDFARNAYFDRIGGSGVALTDPVIITLPEPGFRTRWAIAVNGMRWALAQKIAAKMDPSARGLGVAMVTGHEAWIDPAQEQALRDTGLAHIAAISGLHMTLVGGFSFFLARFLIAAWPWLALRVPGKKLAAVFGLLAVGVYLVVSGAPPPATRAAITATVAFCAILADRKAISLRALAVAALVIIALQPESVAEPGFQMSFAATAAIVALVEIWLGRPREISTPWPIRIVQGAAFWLVVSLGVSFVAGLATGPFAIQHFNRVAVYGLPANLSASPLINFLLMPSLALGAALEPLGLGGPFLKVASWAINLLQGGAGWMAARPGAVMLVPSAPALALPVAFIGTIWVCIWKGRGRWIGVPAALAVVLWPRPEAPIAWVDNEGAQAALRLNGEAVPYRPETRLFGVEYWSRRHGLSLAAAPVNEALGAVCNGSGCRAGPGAFPRLSVWWTTRKPGAAVLEDYCRASDILVIRAEVDLPASCDGVQVLRADAFSAGGALEIYSDGRLEWAQPRRGQRPWTLSGSGG